MIIVILNVTTIITSVCCAKALQVIICNWVRNGLSFPGEGARRVVLGRSLISPDLLKFSEYAQWVKFLLHRPESYRRIVFRTDVLITGERAKKAMSKEEIIQRIIELLKECNDVPLLDLILKLLRESL